MKKKLILSCALCVLFQIVMLSYCAADDLETEKIDMEEIKGEILATSGVASDEPIINARAAIVIDRDSKCVLYSKNADEKRAMASTTKIMTAIVALENYDIEEEITVSKKAASIGGSRLGLKAGDKISMNDLIYGLMLRSRERCSSANCGNDWRQL